MRCSRTRVSTAATSAAGRPIRVDLGPGQRARPRPSGRRAGELADVVQQGGEQQQVGPVDVAAGTGRPRRRSRSGAGRRCAGARRCAAGGSGRRPTRAATPSTSPAWSSASHTGIRPGPAASRSEQRLAGRGRPGRGQRRGSRSARLCDRRPATAAGRAGRRSAAARSGEHRVVGRVHAEPPSTTSPSCSTRPWPSGRSCGRRGPAPQACGLGTAWRGAPYGRVHGVGDGARRVADPRSAGCRRRAGRPGRRRRPARPAAAGRRPRPVTTCSASRTSSSRAYAASTGAVRAVGQPGRRQRPQHGDVPQPAAGLLEVGLEQVLGRVAVPVRAARSSDLEQLAASGAGPLPRQSSSSRGPGRGDQVGVAATTRPGRAGRPRPTGRRTATSRHWAGGADASGRAGAPASQTGYQSRSASPDTSAVGRDRPSCSRTRSRSLTGPASPRARLPTAASATPRARAPRVAQACDHSPAARTRPGRSGRGGGPRRHSWSPNVPDAGPASR